LHNGEPEKEKEREEHQLISGQTGRIEWKDNPLIKPRTYRTMALIKVSLLYS
jgi:hypothetical protein